MPEAEPPADYPSSAPPPVITYKQPAQDTVILANSFGYIIGGYSGGKWLKLEEAAAYCAEPMAFYEYGLSGRGEKIDSSGVSSEESSVTDVWNEGMDEDTSFDYYVYLLDIGDAEPSNFLFYAGQGRFPTTSKLSDTSSVLSAVQPRLDDHFGAGKVEAQINVAVTADIDDDGSDEIVFNSCNTLGDDSEGYEDYVDEGYGYCLSGIIEEDGSLHLLSEEYDTGFSDEAGSEVIRSIIDINGDGKCEIIAEYEGNEVWTTIVYKYDSKTEGREFTDVISYMETP
jgi:hypothetical protein